jgi:hypothetical protein
MNKQIVYVYALSIILATPVTELWSRLLHRAALKIPRDEKDEEASRVPWIPRLVGILERLIITTLVGWNVSGATGFIGGWIAVKSAGGWQTWSRGTT